MKVIAARFVVVVFLLAGFSACHSTAGDGLDAGPTKVLFTNLGDGRSYGSNFEFVQVGGGTPGQGILYIGTRFVPTASGPLAQIMIPVANSQAVETFALYADPQGAPSATGFAGQPLESWQDVVVPSTSGTIPIPSIPLLTVRSAAHPMLSAGSTYWFWVSSAGTGAAFCCPPGSPPSLCTPQAGGPVCPPSAVLPTLGSFWSSALQGSGGFWGGPFAAAASSSSSAPPAIEVDGSEGN